MNTYPMRVRRTAYVMLFAGFIFSVAPTSLFAARPTAARLLPEKTLVMVSVPNARELAEKFMNTSLGKISQDPQMKPLIDEIYGSFGELVDKAKDQIGLSLNEIVNLPQGEITFAIVEPSNNGPGMVFLFEAGDQRSNARKLLDKALSQLKLAREETIGDVKCSVYDMPGNQEDLIVFEKDNTFAFTTKLDVAKQVLDLWNEKKDTVSLAENANYAAISSRCRGSNDEEPQLIWYADPVGFMKKMAETETGMTIAVAMLPALGLDGLSGLGGSILFDTEQFDSMMHLHVLLTSPRTGVIKAIAFEPGVTKPERWVPGDIAQYDTLHWNFKDSLSAIETLFDSFRGDGAFAQTVQNFTRNIEVDLQKQVVPALEGRVTYISRVEKPVTLQSSHSLVALKLKGKEQDKENNAESIQLILDGIAKKFPDTISSQTSAGKTYYRVNTPTPPRFADSPDPPPMPHPCFGIVEDYLMISNQEGIFQQVLATAADSSKSLSNELDFKLIASKLERMTSGTKPAMMGFNRPEEGLRFLYDLATSDRAKSRLQRRAERGNPFFKSLNSSLEKQPLPPFSVIQKYLAPSGGLVIDDDTGIHYMNFTLKRQSE